MAVSSLLLGIKSGLCPAAYPFTRKRRLAISRQHYEKIAGWRHIVRMAGRRHCESGWLIGNRFMRMNHDHSLVICVLACMAQAFIHFFDIIFAGDKLYCPYDNKNQEKNTKVLKESHKTMFHPVRKISNGHHYEGNNQKINSGLLYNAPMVYLPYH